jgi:Ca-activated chloride channel family protein
MQKSTNLIVLAFVALCGLIAFFRLAPSGSRPSVPGFSSTTTVGSQSEDATAGNAIQVLFASSDGKKEWVDAVTESFHRSNSQVNGRPIRVTVDHMRSGESRQKILDGKAQPTIWGPAGPSWVALINQDWLLRQKRPFLEEVRPTVRTGLVIAMWQPMAEALGWPTKRIGWADLVRVANNPKGWAAYNHPEWGQFRFGHAHPDYSNSAMLSVISEIYAAAGKTEGLTAADLRNPKVRDAVRATEQAIVHYGESSSWLVEKLCVNGPAYLSALTIYESSVIKANTKYPEKPFPLVAIYPREGTFWEDHPAGIVNADWVTSEQRAAARQYLEYLAAAEQQERATEFGFRPTRTGITLKPPFDRAHGVDPGQNGKPQLAYVSEELFQRANELWHQVKKKASIYLVLDTSGSMEGPSIEAAKRGAAGFVKHLERDDEVHAWTFNSAVTPLGEGGRAGAVSEQLSGRFGGLFATGGTALYDAVIHALTAAQEERRFRKDQRLYAVVLLSDGQDTDSKKSLMDVMALLPKSEEADGTRIFSIAYGEEADKEILQRISEQSNGRMFQSGTEDLEAIYNSIAAYF